MPVLAKTPAQVIAGEATYNGDTWSDMLNIASVIANRALTLGVTQQQVIGVQKEFNAYNKSLPPGADVDLAQAALENVEKFGPTHPGTFYSMPTAAENLPSGLDPVAEVEGGHRFYSDPEERSIRTSVGYRVPTETDTVRAAAAQRQEFDARLATEQAMAAPVDRPMAQPADIASFAAAMQAQRQIAEPGFDPARMAASPELSASDMAMQSAMVNSDAAKRAMSMDMSRFGDVPSQQPADIGGFAQAMQAQRQVSEPGFDMARMEDSAPLGDAAKALQAAMENSDAAQRARAMDQARFGDPAVPDHAFGNIAAMGIPEGFAATLAAQPVSAQTVSTTSISPAQAEADANAQTMDQSRFDGGSPSTVSIDPGRFGDVPAASFDPGRFGPTMDANAAIQAAIDNSVANSPQSRPSLNNFADLAAAGPMGLAVAPSIASGINSPQHQQIASQAAANLESVQSASDAANALGGPLSFERTNIPAPAITGPTVEGWSDMAAAGPVTAVDPNAAPAEQAAATPASTMSPSQISGYKEMAARAYEAGLTNLSGNTRINAFGELESNVPAANDFAAEVAAQTPADEFGHIRAQIAANPIPEATPAEIQNTMVEYGKIPVPTPSPLSTPTLSEEVTDQPAPALETITVADTPTIAPAVEDTAVTPSVTPSVTPAASSSPLSASQALGTAMGVWGGQITTGTATDGSTVSRLDDGRVARYNPKFDHTEYTSDEGKTWTGLTEGNQIPGQQTTKTLSSPSISASPSAAKTMGNSIANGSMAGSVIGALGLGALLGLPGAVIGGLVGNKIGGTQLGDGVPDQGPLGALMGLLSGSPTGVATRGTDGGMRTGTHGPAGTPGGYGPGGTGSSAGGYGTTGGHDPDGTR